MRGIYRGERSQGCRPERSAADGRTQSKDPGPTCNGRFLRREPRSASTAQRLRRCSSIRMMTARRYTFLHHHHLHRGPVMRRAWFVLLAVLTPLRVLSSQNFFDVLQRADSTERHGEHAAAMRLYEQAYGLSGFDPAGLVLAAARSGAIAGLRDAAHQATWTARSIRDTSSPSCSRTARSHRCTPIRAGRRSTPRCTRRWRRSTSRCVSRSSKLAEQDRQQPPGVTHRARQGEAELAGARRRAESVHQC